MASFVYERENCDCDLVNRPLYSCFFSDLAFNGSKSAGDCFDNDLTVFVCRANQVVLMLISWHLIEKRSAPGLAFIGQVTEHTAVKWPHDYRAIEISSS